jgi:GAF domain-containing protein
VNTLLDSRLFQSTIVNELGSLAIKMYDFDETVAAVLDLLAKVVDFTVAILVVRDQPESYLRVQLHSPITSQALAEVSKRLEEESDLHSLTMSLGQLEQGLTQPIRGLPRDLRSFVVLAMKSRNRVSGLLALGSDRENAISDELMETLRIFAHEAAIVLDNSLLYRQLGRANRELQRTIDELQASKARERALRQEVQALKIEIDEAKRERQVAEITETDYFQQLRERARRMRDKGSGQPPDQEG